MGAAIWSTSPRDMLAFPATSFIEFFDNHCLLQWDRPRWRTVTGGSRAYVKKLAAIFGDQLRLACGADKITRDEDGVTDLRCERPRRALRPASCSPPTHRTRWRCWPTPATTSATILGACRYAPNDVWLHRDASLMPQAQGRLGLVEFPARRRRRRARLRGFLLDEQAAGHRRVASRCSSRSIRRSSRSPN